MIYTSKIKKAIRFSIKTHEVYQKQKRKGKDIPYVTHPLTVGLILASAGTSENVIVAGILHDTIEDSVAEKKVTREIIAERFGEDVAVLVMSVTETDKTLSWEERKKEALTHIENFSRESLLVKSADVIANASELVDDVAREGEEVFARFNASKEKILKQLLKIIATILSKWEENPLADDLRSVATDLQQINAQEFMMAHRSKKMEYRDYNEDISLECLACSWKGIPKNGCIEYSDVLLDISCPICDKMLLVVNYPSTKEL